MKDHLLLLCLYMKSSSQTEPGSYWCKILNQLWTQLEEFACHVNIWNIFLYFNSKYEEILACTKSCYIYIYFLYIALIKMISLYYSDIFSKHKYFYLLQTTNSYSYKMKGWNFLFRFIQIWANLIYY